MDTKHTAVGDAPDRSCFTRMMAHGEYNTTRFFCATIGNCVQLNTIQDMFQNFQTRSDSGSKGICVIENASPNVVQALLDNWQVEEEFFIAHASNRPLSEIWTDRRKHDLQSQSWRSIEGIYIQRGATSSLMHPEKGRLSYWDRERESEPPKSRVSSSTRISYCKVGQTGWCKVYYVDHRWKRY